MTNASEKIADVASSNGDTASRVLSNPLPVGKAVALATDLGVGFLGLSVAGWGLTVAVASFKHALTSVKA